MDASVYAYIEKSASQYSTAPQLIKQLRPADEKRMAAMMEVIGLRQDRYSLLSDEQWDAVIQ